MNRYEEGRAMRVVLWLIAAAMTAVAFYSGYYLGGLALSLALIGITKWAFLNP
jgi:hypothetical protein